MDHADMSEPLVLQEPLVFCASDRGCERLAREVQTPEGGGST